MSAKNIESVLVEKRVFKPSREFVKKARVQSLAQYRAMWEESVKKPEKFWAREAADLVWQKKWTKVLDHNWHDCYGLRELMMHVAVESAGAPNPVLGNLALNGT